MSPSAPPSTCEAMPSCRTLGFKAKESTKYNHRNFWDVVASSGSTKSMEEGQQRMHVILQSCGQIKGRRISIPKGYNNSSNNGIKNMDVEMKSDALQQYHVVPSQEISPRCMGSWRMHGLDAAGSFHDKQAKLTDLFCCKTTYLITMIYLKIAGYLLFDN
ncbi:hypothetical protein D1007_39543 [Hordeum vulgare]|nr:hypothetical protein D1007_39543 [Hordeum vulgare]